MTVNPLNAGLVVGTKQLLEGLQSALQNLPARILIEQPAIGDLSAFLDRIEEVRLDVLIVEVGGLLNHIDDIFAKLKSVPAPPTIIAVHGSADPETILASMRAGANEFLYPPLADNLQAAFERIVSGREQQRKSGAVGGRTTGFFSAKGGCGATTIACHLAVEFQRQTQHKILLADFDMDAGLVRFFMKAKSSYSVLDAVNNVHRLDLNFWRALISNGMPRLEVIAAPAAMASREAPAQESFQHVLHFARAHYDWILVDLGRSLNRVSMNALEEIDEAFLITTLDVPALYHGKHLVQTLLDSGYGRKRLHVIVNRAPKRPEVTVQEVEHMLGLPVYAVLPDDYAALYEACAEGGLLAAGTGLGMHFARLAAKVAGVPEQKNRKTRFQLFG